MGQRRIPNVAQPFGGGPTSKQKSQNRVDVREHEREVETYKTQRPAEAQRDTTSLGALAKSVQQSKPLSSRLIGSSKPMGLMKSASRSITR